MPSSGARFGLGCSARTSARALVIQYGGSVKPDNAAALQCRPGVDGVLVGGASLHADDFLAIVHATGAGDPPTEGSLTSQVLPGLHQVRDLAAM